MKFPSRAFESPSLSKVAFVLWAGRNFGGAERRFMRLAHYLAAENLAEVTIICTAESIKTIKTLGLGPTGVRYKLLNTEVNNSKLITTISKIFSLLNLKIHLTTTGYDRIFYCSNPDSVSYFLTRLVRLHPPFSIALVDLGYSHNSTWWNRFFSKQVLRSVKYVDCLSPGVRDAYFSTLGICYSQKFKIAPCSFTDFSRVKYNSIRDIDIVLIGRFVDLKGHELLAEISEDLASYNVHVCGDGPLEINIPGAKVYKAIDPFDILSRSKVSLSIQKLGNYPSQVALESMASGCAIIATDTGETRLFLDEYNSILINYDSSELLSAIRLLLTNESIREKLVEESVRRVFSEQTIERYSRYFLEEVLDI